MAKTKERLEAERLRKVGWSINKIANYLGVSKSSVSNWCNDIALTKKQKERLLRNSIKGGHKGRILGALTNKKRKQDVIDKYNNEGLKLVKNLSKRDLMILGAGLYWAEGSKTGGRLTFVNSDPNMALIALMFFIEILGARMENIRVTVQINRVHEKRINEVIDFWSQLLNISRTQFNKPYYINVVPKKIYSNYNQYYGLVRLRVLKGSRLQYKVLGLINGLKQNCRGSSVG